MIFRLTILLSLLCILSFGQSLYIKGSVEDIKDESPLIGANIILIHLPDSVKKVTTVDINGQFLFPNIQEGLYSLKTSYIGYQSYEQKNITLKNASIDLGRIKLTPSVEILNNVNIVGKIPPSIQKGDTTQYNSDAFKTNPDANAEDLVGKMPGITVQDGKVQAHGEDVKQVLVDGKPFFGDDANAVLKNIPVEIIDKIQVFTKQSDQSAFTGFDDGNSSKTINIITKPSMRNGQFGKLYAGYGIEDKYKTGGNMNFFNGDRRISVLAQSNNVNEQNFSSEDLSGVMSSGSQSNSSGGGGNREQRSSGGGRGSGGDSRQGNDANNFLVDQKSGISTTHSGGINYLDKWGKKTDVTASYFFNQTNNTAGSTLLRQYVLPSDSGQVYNENNVSENRNINHRFNLKLNYELDSSTSILLRPKISVQQNNGKSALSGSNQQEGLLLNKVSNNFNSDLQALSFSNQLLLKHKFSKKGRTASLDLTNGYNKSKGDNKLFSMSDYYSSSITSDSVNQTSHLDKSGWSISPNLTYTEPLGKTGSLELKYIFSFAQNNSDKRTFNLSSESDTYNRPDTQLTNVFNSQYITHLTGTSYRYQDKKNTLTLGFSYQQAHLNSTQTFPYQATVDKAFNSILPNAMFKYSASKSKSININYRTKTNPPSVEQLQNVVNNTNPVQLITGNPNLLQDYQHSLFVRYSNINTEKSVSFFAFVGGSYTNNYVGNNNIIAARDTVIDDIILLKGAQLRQPVNLDGYFNVRSFMSYSVPIDSLKSNFNINLSASFSRIPSLINNQINYANNPSTGLGLLLTSNISKKVDFTISSNSSLNFVQNTLQHSNTQFFNQNSKAKLNLILGKGLVLNSELNHQFYTGISDNYERSYFLWNGGIGYKFLKDNKAEVRFSVVDILNQNKNIQRNITEAYTEDLQTNILQRYYLLSFTYNIKNYINKDRANSPTQ